MASTGRITALLVHGDVEVLDYLTRAFGGFAVITAVSAFRAQAHLEGDRTIDVVVAPWHPAGIDTYRWVLQNRPEMRTKFVFVADDVSPEFDAVVRGRCLTVPLDQPQELVRVATVIARRRALHTPPRGIPILGRPTLLLVDDDPLLLEAMAALLEAAGYTVSQVDSAAAARSLLEQHDFNAIICNWHIHDGSGADLYEWIIETKPVLAARVVFLVEGTPPDAFGRPIFRKGQDSRELTSVLAEIVSKVRR